MPPPPNYILIPSPHIAKHEPPPQKKKDALKRVNALWALNNGMPQVEVAKRFGVCTRTLRYWQRQFRENDGKVAPTSPPGRPAGKKKELHDAIAELYRQNPNLTPEEVELILEVSISRKTIHAVALKYGLRMHDEHHRQQRKEAFRRKDKTPEPKPFSFCMLDLLD